MDEAEIRPYGQLEFSYGLRTLLAVPLKMYYRKDDGAISMFRPLTTLPVSIKVQSALSSSDSGEIFMGGLKKLLEIDADWVPNAEDRNFTFVRFCLLLSGFIAFTSGDNCFLYYHLPVGPYSGSVKVKIEQEFTRATGGVLDAKAAGNYGRLSGKSHQEDITK